MKRVLAFALAMMLLLAGCAGSDEQVIDLEEASKAVAEGNFFTDDMNPAKTDVLLALYGLTQDEVAQVVGYVGSGATAEELTLWKASSSDAAAAIAEKVQGRVDTQISSFQDYNPEEVPKLESAVILQKGNFVALCVCADNAAAREILEPYFK